MDCPVQPTHGRTADLLDGAVWRSSSYSGTHGNCVEVAVSLPGWVAVRDSKDPDGPTLLLSAQAWRGFVCGVKDSAVG